MKNSIEDNIKKGTTTVGIVCKNGVILAADRRASGGFISDKDVLKIQKINEDLVLTTAGTVSSVQLMVKLIRAQISLKETRLGKKISTKESVNLLAGLVYGMIRTPSMIPDIAHFLVAGRDNEGIYLYDIAPDGSLLHKKDFTSSGSGSVMAYGVLEAMYKEDMSLEDGVKVAKQAMNSAIQRDLYTGNGLDVITLTKDGIKWVVSNKIETKIE